MDTFESKYSGFFQCADSSLRDPKIFQYHNSTESISLRAGSLGEREPARIPITFTCMRTIFGRIALIG